VAQLVHNLSYHADTRGIIGRRLRPVMSEPALKLANRNPDQLCESLLRGGEGVDGPGKYVADRNIIVIRLIFGDVTQCMAELLERNANIPTPVLIVVVAERFLRAKRRRPQGGREIWVGHET
jgi:hypothetical protein